MYSVKAENFSQWRRLARELLKRHIPPEQLCWQQEEQSSLLFNDEDYLALPVQSAKPVIPKAFLGLGEMVACFRDESRWSQLYAVAWRLVFEDRYLLGNKIDPQVSSLFAMQSAVSRDRHKMKAFVRFNKIEAAQESYVAWFEPEHFIVPLVTPFFIKRFNNMCWSILTPDCCVHWDGQQHRFTDGISKPANIGDELEHLWKTYYGNIFNPARLKLKAMQSEMPKKYWVNLPEAPLIAELTRSSSAQTEAMIAHSESPNENRVASSRYVKQLQTRRQNDKG